MNENFIYIKKDELEKLKKSPLLDEERSLLILLKVLKINRRFLFDSIIKVISSEDEAYIVNLLEKREGQVSTMELPLNPICLKLLDRLKSHINRKEPEFLMTLKKHITL